MGNKDIRTQLGNRLDMLLKDDWRFTLGQFAKRVPPTSGDHEQGMANGDYTRKWNNMVNKNCEAGEYRRAMAVVQNYGVQPVVPSMEVYNKLQSKHPSKNAEAVAAEDWANITNYVIPDNAEGMNMHWSELQSIIKRMKNKVKTGPVDKLRAEFLKQLCGRNSDPANDELKFMELLSEALSLIGNGKFPVELGPMIRDCEMFGGPKKDPGDVRPIGIGSIFKKLVGLWHRNRLTGFNKEQFGDVQFALKPNGAESIISAFNVSLETMREKHKLALDGKNAFNSCNRSLGMREIWQFQKEVLPYFQTGYVQEDPKLWYFGMAEGIKPIQFEEGFMQGDVLATWAYIMTIQPFLLQLKEILGEEDFNMFFVDDGNLVADHDKAKAALMHIFTEGPRYGYNVQKLKGSICLGSCNGDWEMAQQRQQEFIDQFGFDKSIIHIHPDDFPGGMKERMEIVNTGWWSWVHSSERIPT